jgi:alkanesulfonate monooxygenase
MAMRFHWMLVKGGESAQERTTSASRILLSDLAATGLPDLPARFDFCRCAEESGIDSVLVPFGWYEPDPILLIALLARGTRKLRFIAAYRSGLASPTYFVQQINTLSALADGRIALNIVAGHSPGEQRGYGDFLDHDERYERTRELLAICNAFWHSADPVDFQGRHYQVQGGRLGTPFVGSARKAPEIYIGGQSRGALDLVAGQGDCWLCMADAPQALRPQIEPVLEKGKEVGLRLGLIVRPTRQEAVDAAAALVQNAALARREKAFVSGSDSVSVHSTFDRAAGAGGEWLTDCLWAGAVPYYGAPAMALVGDPDQVAETLLEYRDIGVSQFIFHGWPKLEEMLYFGREVLPRVRRIEERDDHRSAAHG